MPDPTPPDLHDDPLLRGAPTIEGFKVLDPAVLYARIGQGGMGAVYRGRHCKLDLDVAVKCLKPALADDSPEFVARFEREARLAASLAHQNVVRVMDVHHKHDLHYLVMEFVTGETARERVQRKGALAAGEALAILLGAVQGLAEAHGRGIVHRDIKPDNVLVSVEGRVKLADLGLAKAVTSSGRSISLASSVMGTPQYMAPEQWDSPDVGPTADVWALGATLYYLLTGEHAIEAPSLAATARRAQEQPFPSLRDRLPPLRDEVHELLERATAREPDARFADARELLSALRPLVDVDEQQLADPAAAQHHAEEAVVSPPPRQTLLTIRAKIESGVGSDPEAPTIPSPNRERSPAPAPPRSRVRLFVLGAAALLAGLLGGYLGGLFDEPTDWDEVERQAEARRLFFEAKDLLPKANGLDEAIDKLERCLQLWPEHEGAAAPLALALDKRAEKLERSDLDAAFTASRRAHELASDRQAIADRHQRLGSLLRKRLFDGLSITRPAGVVLEASRWIVVPEARFRLVGTVTSPAFTELQLLYGSKALADVGAGVWRKVPVVAGEFALDVELPGPGDWPVTIAMTGEQGVTGSMKRTFRVCGDVGERAPTLLVGSAPQVTIQHAGGGRMLPVSVSTFQMGSPNDEQGRASYEYRHEVQLLHAFWMADTEVTRGQYQRVLGASAGWQTDARLDDLPAGGVTFAQANEFCARLTELEREAGRLPDGYAYMLPSEAQWEYACRGGVDAPFGGGADYTTLPQFAVFDQPVARSVAMRKPNGYGLYDMHGNLAEWCRDHGARARDGVGVIALALRAVEPVSIQGPLRIVRGGHFRAAAAACRSAARDLADPDASSPTVGFRPVLAKLL